MAAGDGHKQTPLHRCHVEANARLVDFAGWEMPVSYSGILAEHLAVRRKAGLFDVSHMGEIRVTGAGAESFVDSLTPNRVRGLRPGRAQYNALLTDAGTFIDDLIVYRLDAETILLVVNASNTAKDLAWILDRARDGVRLEDDVRIEDVSDSTALLALQGPLAAEILAPLALGDVAALRSFDLISTDGRRSRRRGVAHRLHWRGRLRDLRGAGGRRAGLEPVARDRERPRAAPHRSRRARQSAARGGAVPLRPRDRRHGDAVRSRARLGGEARGPRLRREGGAGCASVPPVFLAGW